MNKKSLDDLFREPLEDASDTPAGDLWQRLETRLDDRKTARKRRRKIRFLQPSTTILVVVLLLFVAVAVWYFVKKLG
jgi:hypothetical protein